MGVENGQAPTQAPNDQQVNEDWDEKQYKVALAHLEKLQDQLDELRSVIPKIVHSIATPQPTPEALHGAFKNAAWGGSRAIDVFKTLWNGEQTQTVFAKARKSAAENPDLNNAMIEKVPRYGWAEAVKQDLQGEKSVKVEDTPEEEKALTKTETT